MPECPRCRQVVEIQAIACPFCFLPLKAHGHPGIPLYRAAGETPLCLTCAYHDDDSCTFPKRPDAMDCTLYRDRTQSITPEPGYSRSWLLKNWLKRNLGWLALLGLLILSLIIALAR